MHSDSVKVAERQQAKQQRRAGRVAGKAWATQASLRDVRLWSSCGGAKLQPYLTMVRDPNRESPAYRGGFYEGLCFVRSNRERQPSEESWLARLDPWLLPDHLRTERQLRLFGVACCRRIWEADRDLLNWQGRRLVKVAEQYAEGKATFGQLIGLHENWGVAMDEEVREDCDEDCDDCGRSPCIYANADLAVHGCSAPEIEDVDVVPYHARCAVANGRKQHTAEAAAQEELARCIFGNPYRRPVLDPAWFQWNDGMVVTLATAIYDNRQFDALPSLAYAMEQAGCKDRDMLTHLWEHRLHARGCHVLDAILHKGVICLGCC